jgi:hypothetical protein
MENERLAVQRVGDEEVRRAGYERFHAPLGGRKRPSKSASSAADLLLRVLRNSDSRAWLCADVLLKPSFLQQVKREKWRADRSKAPLSIVVCEGRTARDEPLGNEELASTLIEAKRSTDLVGQLGDGLFGVLLPDTSATGATTFTDKIRRRLEPGCVVHSLIRTYPDQLFDALLEGTSCRVPGD